MLFRKMDFKLLFGMEAKSMGGADMVKHILDVADIVDNVLMEGCLAVEVYIASLTPVMLGTSSQVIMIVVFFSETSLAIITPVI